MISSSSSPIQVNHPMRQIPIRSSVDFLALISLFLLVLFEEKSEKIVASLICFELISKFDYSDFT
ncbi:MAG: hypothetical protein EB053_01330 [Chlamydiae bacterium]|nr:hypothetical protein [Chlamydiota bacterium]